MKVPFTSFDKATASFYCRIIANVMLNVHAVRMGYFDTLLCETNDYRVAGRWNEERARVAKLMREEEQ